MLDGTVVQLDSADPAVRRAAIIALGRSKDPAALRPLAAVYRTDPDPALRELALQAGRYIRQHTAAPPPTLEPPPAEAVPAAALPGAEDRAVSERDRERARNYVDTALSHHTAGQRGRAIEALGKALSLDPALAKEPFVRNLMITLTGRASNEALALLTDNRQRAALSAGIDGKEKPASAPPRADDDATWPAVLLDLALYGVVYVLTAVAILVFSIPLIQDLFDSLLPVNSPGTVYLEEYVDDLLDATIAVYISLSGGSATTSIVSLLVYAALIHLSATLFLGGNGPYVGLLGRIVPVFTLATLISAGTFIIFSLFGSADYFLAYSALSFPFALGVLYFIAVKVGEAYRFGTGNGCLAMILSWMIVFFMAGCGWFALGSVFGSLLQAS